MEFYTSDIVDDNTLGTLRRVIKRLISEIDKRNFIISGLIDGKNHWKRECEKKSKIISSMKITKSKLANEVRMLKMEIDNRNFTISNILTTRVDATCFARFYQFAIESETERVETFTQKQFNLYDREILELCAVRDENSKEIEKLNSEIMKLKNHTNNVNKMSNITSMNCVLNIAPMYKKVPIPKHLKAQLWTEKIGRNNGFSYCFNNCGRVIYPDSFHAGHIIPECKGGLATMDNLIPICESCNKSIGSSVMALNDVCKKYKIRTKNGAMKIVSRLNEIKNVFGSYSDPRDRFYYAYRNCIKRDHPRTGDDKINAEIVEEWKKLTKRSDPIILWCMNGCNGIDEDINGLLSVK